MSDAPEYVRVSDHALIRFIERIYGVDLDPVRQELARRCWDAGLLGAKTYQLDDIVFRFAHSTKEPNCIVVTTIMTPEMRKGRPPGNDRWNRTPVLLEGSAA